MGKGRCFLATLKKDCLFFAIILSFVFLHGCATSNEHIETKKSQEAVKLVVLPFNNISGRRDAGKIVADVFVVELFRDKRFDVVEPGNVNQIMFQEWIDRLGEIDIERLNMIGRRMGVSALVTGTVNEFNDGRTGSPPVVALNARMIEVGTGKIIWSANKSRRGDDYIKIFSLGRVRSVITLTQKVVKEMIATMKKKMPLEKPSGEDDAYEKK